MPYCSELNSVPSSCTQYERPNERAHEEGWGKKNKQRKWPSQLLCVPRLLLFSVGFSGSDCISIRFGLFFVLFHTVHGILSHYSVFNRTFNLFRCQSNSLRCSNLIFTSYSAALVEWNRTNLQQFALISFICANCFDNYGEKMRPNVFAWIILINYK